MLIYSAGNNGGSENSFEVHLKSRGILKITTALNKKEGEVMYKIILNIYHPKPNSKAATLYHVYSTTGISLFFSEFLTSFVQVS